MVPEFSLIFTWVSWFFFRSVHLFLEMHDVQTINCKCKEVYCIRMANHDYMYMQISVFTRVFNMYIYIYIMPGLVQGLFRVGKMVSSRFV